MEDGDTLYNGIDYDGTSNLLLCGYSASTILIRALVVMTLGLIIGQGIATILEKA